MSKPKHTSGPWKFSWHNAGRFLSIRTLDGLVTVARVNVTNADREGNASLIAAAPELLRALHALVECSAYGPVIQDADAWKVARAAIAKAEGSTNAS